MLTLGGFGWDREKETDGASLINAGDRILEAGGDDVQRHVHKYVYKHVYKHAYRHALCVCHALLESSR